MVDKTGYPSAFYCTLDNTIVSYHIDQPSTLTAVGSQLHGLFTVRFAAVVIVSSQLRASSVHLPGLDTSYASSSNYTLLSNFVKGRMERDMHWY